MKRRRSIKASYFRDMKPRGKEWRHFDAIAQQTGLDHELIAHIIFMYHREVIRRMSEDAYCPLGELGTLVFTPIAGKETDIPGAFTDPAARISITPSRLLREQAKQLLDVMLSDPDFRKEMNVTEDAYQFRLPVAPDQEPEYGEIDDHAQHQRRAVRD